jgi:hypothetical protein
METDGFRQLRASVCHTFPGYRFEDIDNLTFDELLELAAGAQWVADELEKAANRKTSK